MLLRHSWIYLLARLVPGLVSFGSLVVFTRLMSPEDYGVYVLVMTGVGLAKVGFFGWIELSLTRFYSAALENPRPLLSTVLGLYLAICAIAGCLGLAVAVIWPDPGLRGLLLISIPILWAYSWFELNLKLCQSKLLPVKFGLMMSGRALMTVLLGAWLLIMGAGAYGPLTGFLFGSFLAGIAIYASEWRSIRPSLNREVASGLAQYGLPLTASVGLAALGGAVEKYLLFSFTGEGSVGAYAAASELTGQSLHLLMMSVNLAGTPLVMRAFEQGGESAADQQIRANGSMLLAIALPAATGIAVLAPNIAGTLLGAAFRADAAALLPWLAVGAVMSGMRSLFFNLAFQVKKKLAPLVAASAITTAASILLGLLWIPSYGIMGAVWAGTAAAAISLAASITLGRRHMPINLDWSQVLRIVTATTAMGIIVAMAREGTGMTGLILQVGLGVLAYAACLLALDVMAVRSELLARLRGRLRSRAG